MSVENIDVEDWRDIEGYNGRYQVSNIGRIKSFAIYENGIIMKLSIMHGYSVVTFRDHNTKRKQYKVHRLVAKAFLKNESNLPIINHINGIKTDNRVENLEWCNNSHNVKHAYDTGLITEYKGEKNHSAKLTNEEALEIYRLAWEECLTYDEIAQKYNIRLEAVGQIKYGIIWNSVTHHNPYENDGVTKCKRSRRKDFSLGERNSKAKLTEEQVFEIYNMSIDGSTYAEIADMYGVTKSAISGIRNGHSWNHITHHTENMRGIEV